LSVLIAQITDCHLPADPQQKYRGIKPHKNLKKLLKKVKVMRPDLLLASGDLSEDGSRASYHALKRFFSPLDIPVLALPGNHDDAEMLAEFFPGSPVETFSASEHGPWQIVRLNSCLPGKPEGLLSKKTLLDLEGFLAFHSRGPIVIALHHQPVAINSPWIDKYPLLEPEAFLKLVDQHPNVRAVVWGHVHQQYEADRNGTAMLGGPSSAINGLKTAQKFTPDPSGPACRWLELKTDGLVHTGIVGI
jgi:Icc protein